MRMKVTTYNLALVHNGHKRFVFDQWHFRGPTLQYAHWEARYADGTARPYTQCYRFSYLLYSDRVWWPTEIVQGERK